MSELATAGRPRRVLMVTGAYYPEISSSGVQCRDMARLLAGRAEVHVLTTAADPRLPRHDSVDGVPVTRIRVDVRSAVSKVRAFRRMFLDLFRMVRCCDLVHLHGYSSKNVLVTAMAKLFHKPIVLSLHTAGFDEPESIERQGRLALWAFMSADLYLSVSRGLVDSYLAYGMAPERVLEVPNGIDLVRFAPAGRTARSALRHRLGLPDGRPLVVFVGFFSSDKQPRVLFDAWLQLYRQSRIETTLVFVGATKSSYFEVDDQIVEGMRDAAAAAGVQDRLLFTGATHNVEDYFRAADLFVLPSKREGLPVALLEAMACGLPCIASRLRGSTETIIQDHVNGLLVAPGDAVALAEAMASVLNNARLANTLSVAARATVVRRFANADIADRWLDAYDLVAGFHSRA
ncbi:MAG: glycosyltransferase family 4 protein [Acidobacteriota bacterium]|nr:glycosyltransferase family 4 protein [Acidobacteriota bacterium]